MWILKSVRKKVFFKIFSRRLGSGEVYITMKHSYTAKEENISTNMILQSHSEGIKKRNVQFLININVINIITPYHYSGGDIFGSISESKLKRTDLEFQEEILFSFYS